ncbi:MAG: ROK family protein [bacterium]|nr:ROK family protein [bacterium]
MYFGIDVGGTSIRVAMYETVAAGELPEEVGREEMATSRDFAVDVSAIGATVRNMAGGTPGAIGIGVAGRVSPDRKTLIGSGNLGDWVGQSLVDELEAHCECPVVLGNDAEAAAMAEAHYGAGQGREFYLLIWGTGFGGCLIRQAGRRGPVPLPGEPGHQLLSLDGPECGCGRPGCLEAYVGGGCITKHFGRVPAELTPREWNEVMGWMTMGVTNIVTIQPVPLIVFSGGVAYNQPHLLDELGKRLQHTITVVETPEVRLSALGEDTGCLGAASLIDLHPSHHAL